VNRSIASIAASDRCPQLNLFPKRPKIGSYRDPEDTKATEMIPGRKILIIDDDPSDLDTYGKLLQHAGFESLPVLVRFSGPDPFPETKVDLVLLDYRLNSVKTAPEIAQDIRMKYPEAGIVLLSDLWSAPSDVAPFISAFVRKGEPTRLVQVLRSYLPVG